MASTIRWLCATALLWGVCLGCAAVPPVPAPAAIPPIPTGPATIVIGAPAAQGPSCSLCSFLGLDQIGAGAGGLLSRLRNRLGTRFPGLEAKPVVTAISDPANLKSPNPAVAAAASVKADEDAAPQKIKALNYLAKVGCTNCYPDIEKAFLAALDDCTESVRFAAADNLRDIAGCPCQCCKEKSCCSPAMRKKLREVACATDEKAKCYKEASPRVRRVARLALEKCGCPPPAEIRQQQQTTPEEGPGKKDLPQPPPSPPAPAEAAK